MEQTAHKHPYHIIEPSPWPIMAAFSAGLMLFGGLLYMHHQILWLSLIGLGFLLLTSWLWWRDVIKEGLHDKAHTEEVSHGLRMGMLLFILSEVMFFAAFFWAFFDASLFPKEAIEFTWPPKTIKTLDPFELPFLNTLILLLSGCTVTWAHYSIREGNKDDTVKGIGLTVVLGIIFLFVQAYEYSHASFKFSDGIYASTFYMATGFHGFHVLIGTIFLAVCYFRAAKGQFTSEKHVGFEAASWYWHFVDVVWLFLFVSIYWWGGAH